MQKDGTGQYFDHARYFAPGQNRFISQDPIQDGMNWYAYCQNEPLSGIDPNGTDVITALAGALHSQRKSYGPAVPAPWNRVQELVLAQRRMERSVEGGDMGQLGQDRLRRADALGRNPIVKRSKLRQRLDLAHDPPVEPYR